jgi:hypothetical protein
MLITFRQVPRRNPVSISILYIKGALGLRGVSKISIYLSDCRHGAAGCMDGFSTSKRQLIALNYNLYSG